MTTVPDELQPLVAGLADPGVAGPLLASHRATGGRAAAVLILLSPSPQGLRITFVEKSATLRSHAGQIAFPGGSVEPGDTSAIAAALREGEEEVGIPPAEVQVLGALPPAHVRATGYDVTGVVGYWPTPVPLRPVDTREIAAVHVIDVATLVDPAHRLTWTLSIGFRGPAFVVDDLFIWGFSAMLLDGLLELAGWSQPWDTARTAEVPVRFQRERPR